MGGRNSFCVGGELSTGSVATKADAGHGMTPRMDVSLASGKVCAQWQWQSPVSVCQHVAADVAITSATTTSAASAATGTVASGAVGASLARQPVAIASFAMINNAHSQPMPRERRRSRVSKGGDAGMARMLGENPAVRQLHRVPRVNPPQGDRPAMDGEKTTPARFLPPMRLAKLTG